MLNPISAKKKVAGGLIHGAKKLGGGVASVRDKFHNLTSPKRLIGKIGGLLSGGGIEYHKKQNVITKQVQTVRGNRNKQSPIAGFNAPDWKQFRTDAAANDAKKTGTARMIGAFANLGRNVVGAKYGGQVPYRKK